MITIGWPTLRSQVACQVYRVLDLSGLTRSVRESKNFTKAGYVYYNGIRITSLRHTVPLGVKFRLELRFPNGRTRGQDIMLVSSNRLQKLKPRETSPGENQHINDPPKWNLRG